MDAGCTYPLHLLAVLASHSCHIPFASRKPLYYNWAVVFYSWLSSFPSLLRLRLLPPARVPGPQCGVGFCWYLTSLTDEVKVLGCRVKSACALQENPPKKKHKHQGRGPSILRRWGVTHFGSVVTSLYAGVPSLMLLIFTG
jgi:hypothetical protein